MTVSGEIDLETSARAECRAGRPRRSAATCASISATSRYIDSTGLRVLLTARDAAAEAGGSLRVSATSSIVARLIEITGASDLLGD